MSSFKHLLMLRTSASNAQARHIYYQTFSKTLEKSLPNMPFPLMTHSDFRYYQTRYPWRFGWKVNHWATATPNRWSFPHNN